MPRYTMTIEYVDEDGDLTTDDVIVEAADAETAQDKFLDDVTGFLDDADEEDHGAQVTDVREA